MRSTSSFGFGLTDDLVDRPVPQDPPRPDGLVAEEAASPCHSYWDLAGNRVLSQGRSVHDEPPEALEGRTGGIEEQSSGKETRRVVADLIVGVGVRLVDATQDTGEPWPVRGDCERVDGQVRNRLEAAWDPRRLHTQAARRRNKRPTTLEVRMEHGNHRPAA